MSWPFFASSSVLQYWLALYSIYSILYRDCMPKSCFSFLSIPKLWWRSLCKTVDVQTPVTQFSKENSHLSSCSLCSYELHFNRRSVTGHLSPVMHWVRSLHWVRSFLQNVTCRALFTGVHWVRSACIELGGGGLVLFNVQILIYSGISVAHIVCRF